MVSSGFSDFSVYDGQHTCAQSEYERNRIKPKVDSGVSKVSNKDVDTKIFTASDGYPNLTEEMSTPSVHIECSCIPNGAASAQAGYGLLSPALEKWGYIGLAMCFHHSVIP